MNTTMISKMVDDAQAAWPAKFNDYEDAFNRCCLSISNDIMKRLGLFQKQNESLTFEEIMERASIVPDAEYLMKKLLYILVEDGVLEEDDNSYICKTILDDIASPAEMLAHVTRLYPEEGAPFQWLARAYGGMHDFISGRVQAEDIMFPWGSFDLVEDVYYSSTVYGFYSKLSGKAIKHLIDHEFDRKVTMLEVGAGTGNGTANVFEHVDDAFETYMFTDISRSLTKKAKKRFSHYDFLEYKLFDISKPFAEQGFEAENFDIVLGVNVFHATPNAVESISHAYNLLRPGGYLVLSEIAPPRVGLYRYMELTFGLLNSYTAYEDRDMRPDGPIVRPEIWIDILHRAGFKSIEAIPHEKVNFEDRGGIVIAKK